MYLFLSEIAVNCLVVQKSDPNVSATSCAICVKGDEVGPCASLDRA